MACTLLLWSSTKGSYCTNEPAYEYGGTCCLELSSKFPIHTRVGQGLVDGQVLFILFLAAIEVALVENSMFHRVMGVKLGVAKGDITDVTMRKFQRASIKIMDCIYVH